MSGLCERPGHSEIQQDKKLVDQIILADFGVFL